MRWLVEGKKIPSDVTIQVLTQARDHIIERTFESLEGIPQAIVHFYNSTSTLQRKVVFNQDKQGVKQIAIDGANLVKKLATQKLISSESKEISEPHNNDNNVEKDVVLEKQNIENLSTNSV